MQILKFVTKEDNDVVVWCATNRLVVFRDFMQWVLDSINYPEEFMIVDVEKGLVYDMCKVATKEYGMRKRTSKERMNGVYTGKWSKYTNAELERL